MTSEQSQYATPVCKLYATIDALMEVVEGVRSERWNSEGKRLKDTKEWCDFYCAWHELKRQD